MTELATSPPPTTTEPAPVRSSSPASAWLKWLARRLGLAVLTLWLCSVLVFFATAALAAQLKLDQPVIVRYFDWLGSLLTGNLGTSIANGLPVSELVGDRIINS